MIYSKCWTIILVFGILACEPAIGVQIGSENEFDSNQIVDIPASGKNTFNKIKENHHSDDYALKQAKINHENNVDYGVKGLYNYNLKNVAFHKGEKKVLKNKNLSKNIHANKSNSPKSINKTSVGDKNVHAAPVINNKSTESTVKSTPETTDNSNAQDNNPITTDTILLNGTTSNNTDLTNETTSNNTDLTNETTSNNTDLTKGTVINNTVCSNGTVFNNTTCNATVNNLTSDNNTNLNNTNDKTDNSNSTKQKVIDTLWDIGYIATAIATACALFPDSTASKVVAVGAAIVAGVVFIAAAIIDWLW